MYLKVSELNLSSPVTASETAVLTNLLNHVCQACTALAAYFLPDVKPN